MPDKQSNRPSQKFNIAGHGPVALLTLYFLWKKYGNDIRVTFFSNDKLSTGERIAPSLTHLEALAVLPPTELLEDALNTAFYKPNGMSLRQGEIDNSEDSKRFIRALKNEIEESPARDATLKAIGVEAMLLWHQIYQEADKPLREIFDNHNFRPCFEPKTEEEAKQCKGYRIDFITESSDCDTQAEQMIEDCQRSGYRFTQKLSADDVIAIDPHYKHFVEQNSFLDGKTGQRVFKPGCAAILRPGGRIAPTFFNDFSEYLQKKIGTYTNNKGKIKPKIRFKKGKVTKVAANLKGTNYRATGFFTEGRDKPRGKDENYPKNHFIFMNGNGIGQSLADLNVRSDIETMQALGAILKFELPVAKDEDIPQHNQEIHSQDGSIIFSIHAFPIEEKKERRLFIGIGGTKAKDDEEVLTEERQTYFDHRHLLQFRTMCQVYGDYVLRALKNLANYPDTLPQEATTLITLPNADLMLCLRLLVDANIVKRDHGWRSVTSKQFPIIDKHLITKDGHEYTNIAATSGASSGGVSIAPFLGRATAGFFSKKPKDDLTTQAYRFGAVLNPLRPKL